MKVKSEVFIVTTLYVHSGYQNRHLHPKFPSGSFPSDLWIKILYAFFFCPIRATLPPPPRLFSLSILQCLGRTKNPYVPEVTYTNFVALLFQQ
jgi:hypothetical protein